MRVGSREQFSEEIVSLGYNETDSLTILGIEIDYDLNCLNTCHNATIEKIKKIINFWNKFSLTLPGRINVAKTLLLSQISYLGSIIMPTNNQLRTITDLVENFVRKNITISKERFYLPPDLGGLGLINITDFLISQQVTWIRKAQMALIDNWQFDLFKLGNGNCLTVNKETVDAERHPILHGLSISLSHFLEKFYLLNKNYELSYILNNPIITRSRNDNSRLNYRFFVQNPPVDEEKLAMLKFSDFMQGNRAIALETINITKGTNFNLLTYMRIIEALSNFLFKFKKNRHNDSTSSCPLLFLNKYSKGSKHIRKILETQKISNIKRDKVRSIATFIRLTNINPIADNQRREILSCWNRHFYPNRLREFLFKFYSNTLGLNTRISHFVENVDRKCTFCKLTNQNTINEESFRHLFCDCSTTKKLQNQFLREFFPELNRENEGAQTFLLLGTFTVDNESKQNLFVSTAIYCCLFLIWEYKLKKKIPSYETFKNEFVIMLSRIYDTSRKIQCELNNTNFSLCRNWRGFQRDGP